MNSILNCSNVAKFNEYHIFAHIQFNCLFFSVHRLQLIYVNWRFVFFFFVSEFLLMNKKKTKDDSALVEIDIFFRLQKQKTGKIFVFVFLLSFTLDDDVFKKIVIDGISDISSNIEFCFDIK